MKVHYLGSAKQDLRDGFPFAIYYTIEENVIKVYAVLDCRKDPAWIRKRLK